MPSFASHLDVAVHVPGLGEVRVDIAYGGVGRSARCLRAFARLRHRSRDDARVLADLGERIRPAVIEQVEIAHPAEPALGVLSFVVFTGPPRGGGDGRNATIVAPGSVHRSATGTATSARIALLAARGELAVGSGSSTRA